MYVVNVWDHHDDRWVEHTVGASLWGMRRLFKWLFASGYCHKTIRVERRDP